MILNRWRRRSAWICLAAMPLVLACSPACAEMIESCLTKHAGINEARLRLNESLIVQKLCDLGMQEEHAVALTKAMLSENVRLAMRDAVHVSESGTVIVDATQLQAAASIVEKGLARQGVTVEEIGRSMASSLDGTVTQIGDRESLMRKLAETGCSPARAQEIVAAMDDVEIQWVGEQQVVCAAGKVVGINYLPIIIILVGFGFFAILSAIGSTGSPVIALVMIYCLYAGLGSIAIGGAMGLLGEVPPDELLDMWLGLLSFSFLFE